MGPRCDVPLELVEVHLRRWLPGGADGTDARAHGGLLLVRSPFHRRRRRDAGRGGGRDVSQTSSGSSARRAAGSQASSRKTRNGTVTTRLVAGACIFLNRPDHPGGPGCALHRAALDRGVPPLELKPDVCWQLPLRREDTVAPDGHVTSVLSEWGRRHWGAGGAEFHWWCTEAPEAFSGARARLPITPG